MWSLQRTQSATKQTRNFVLLMERANIDPLFLRKIRLDTHRCRCVQFSLLELVKVVPNARRYCCRLLFSGCLNPAFLSIRRGRADIGDMELIVNYQSNKV